MDDLEVNTRITIPGWELWFSASRSGGPGGQHANKVASRVTLSWSVDKSSVLESLERDRLKHRLRSHINDEGVLSYTVDSERSQHRNIQIARDRMAEAVAGALKRRKRRKRTRPSRAARRRRLENKRHRGRIKSLRKPPEEP